MSIFSLIADVLFVGHSLVGPNLPPLVEAGLRAQGAEVTVQAQIINGAPLKYQWENSANAEGVDARTILAIDGTDVLILTEAIPLAGQVEWNDSAGRVAAFAALAWEKNPETQVFLYETWHSLMSAPGAVVEGDPGAGVAWRARIAADLPLWQSLATKANAARPASAPPVRVIPAGQAMALAASAAKAGDLPGVPDIQALFADDIHPNGKGLYLVAMVHLAAITGQSPEGLSAKLTRQWQSRDAVISDELALAMQRIAWAAVQAQGAVVVEPKPEPAPVAEHAAPAMSPEPTSFTPVTNPALALGLVGVNDWSVQQPFLDVMKTARPWTGHLPDQWGGMEYDALAAGGWLDAEGWPLRMPPQITGLSTLILTDLPEEAGGVAGRYVLRWKGRGDLRLEGRAQNVTAVPGGLSFEYTPGEGAVLLTLTAIAEDDPLRDLTVVREDRVAAFDGGALFNPDWLARIRGVSAIRFMDWMMTNDSTLATVAASPKPDDFTYARNGVPIEVMVALANELDADPWFTIPHLASDDMVRFYAETVADLLKPGLRAHVEFSNEVWNPQFAQGRWAAEQAKARWGDEGARLQYYGLRAAEVVQIWTDVFGEDAPQRLVRVIATQTGALGVESAFLDAPLLVAEGGKPPVDSFDAYAVTGYFAGLLGTDLKAGLVRGWLAESLAAAAAKGQQDSPQRYDLAVGKAVAELTNGAHSGVAEDTLDDVMTRVLPYHAQIAKDRGLTLMMYEGGTHVVGIGALVDDAEMTAFFHHLNYTPEMGALYGRLLATWARLTPAPFNAFVDVYRPMKWGSWGALRHLGDENPRWQALARGCDPC